MVVNRYNAGQSMQCSNAAGILNAQEISNFRFSSLPGATSLLGFSLALLLSHHNSIIKIISGAQGIESPQGVEGPQVVRAQ